MLGRCYLISSTPQSLPPQPDFYQNQTSGIFFSADVLFWRLFLKDKKVSVERRATALF